MKYIDNNGLAYLWLTLKGKFVQKEYKTGSDTQYKVLSDNNLTDALVTKINEAGNSSFSGDYNALSNKPDLTVFVKETEMNTAINNAVANMNKKQVVTSLEQMTDGNTIYLMPNSENENNLYDEYIIVNDLPEKIGTTEVDLSGYVKVTDLVVMTNAEIDDILMN